MTPPAEPTPLVENRKVYIALPSYKTMHPKTAFSLLSLMDRRRMAASLDYGDAFIAHSRNKLADSFLRSGLEWMLTVDDDMILPAGNGAMFQSFLGREVKAPFCNFNAIDRLLSHGKTLVGALYFGRWEHGKPVYADGADDKTEEAWARQGPYDLLKPTRWVGTGCMLVHRSVFLDIEKKFPQLARKGDSGGQWFSSSEHDLWKTVRELLDTWEGRAPEDVRTLLDSGMRMAGRNAGLGVGEDVIFCRRALQAGHSPHVDMGLLCGHIGEKVYAGG